MKHLGVMIEDRLSFNSNVDFACKKAVGSIIALTKTMPNNSAISRLLANVSTKLLRYDGPACASAL